MLPAPSVFKSNYYSREVIIHPEGRAGTSSMRESIGNVALIKALSEFSHRFFLVFAL
jgi:hypothetical protein